VSSVNLVRGALLRVGVVFVATAVSSTVWAETINYGNVTAANVVFGNVTEASLTNSSAVYGSPSVSNNSLYFNLSGVGAFNIKAQDGGFDFIDGQLTTTISANAGSGIDTVTLRENGDYSLFGTGSAATQASVALSLASLKIDAVNGVGITPIIVSLSSTLTYNLVDNAGLGSLWSITLPVNIDSILAQNGIKGEATLISLTFDNSIYAYSEITSGAFISKKSAEVDVATSSVPEPSTLALLGVGGIGLAFAAWRKRRAAVRNAA
jgi:hypothetical protein